jgi:preprotein translocase SecE subunit
MTQDQRGEAVRRRGRWARFKAYLRDSWLELQKVIWPSKEEVVKMTGLVVAVVIVVAVFIVSWDQVLLVITRPLYGH